ncbi:MAG: beta-eliminating lyase-related protein, partial [Actinomycetota bacterium]
MASDNAAGAHPDIVQALVRANSDHALAYGQDVYTEQARRLFDDLFGRTVRTEFVYGGTGANVLALACMLKPADS